MFVCLGDLIVMRGLVLIRLFWTLAGLLALSRVAHCCVEMFSVSFLRLFMICYYFELFNVLRV